MGPPITPICADFLCVGARRALPYPPSPAGRRGNQGDEGGRAGIANEELRIAGGGDFGAGVKGTQMDADEGRWTQMNPPICTDYRRFFCVGARRALPYPPSPAGRRGDQRDEGGGARELRMRNCELRVGEGVTLGPG